jgi:tetratricopeptide (TPR) repeat protein
LAKEPKEAAAQGRPDTGVLLAAALVAALAFAAYLPSFSAPFVFDDTVSIGDNPSIRHLASSLIPPADTTVSGRPVLNLSLALDHAAGGTALWVYHATNLAIHVLAALALLGIVRRTLQERSLPVALSVALIWVVHPLNTESVTYVIQRAESLMGLLYLATLYFFIRGSTSGGSKPRVWFALCILACFLGMGTKEVMATAPLIVLLYDRTFLAGTFASALRARGKVYLGLAASWLLLGNLVLSTHGRTGTVGFGAGVSPLEYAQTQLWAVAHYLRLSLWPSPLVFDYGRGLSPLSWGTLPSALVTLGLLASTVWALVKRPALGFLGTFFFAILAPSSSFIPVVTETVAEHRMYLPLVSVVTLAVVALSRVLGRGFLPVCGALAAVLLALTWRRNETYQDAEGLWRSAVSARPLNERAHNNLGYILAAKPGGLDEAISEYNEALRLSPVYAQAHLNLAMALVRRPGALDDAVVQFEDALSLNPALVDAHYNLGLALMAYPGRMDAAIAEYRYALRLKPDYAEAHYNLGCALGASPGRGDEAISEYREALRLKPGFVEAHFNLGCALVAKPGRIAEAIAEFQETLRLNPDYVPALCNLATALNSIGRKPEAIASIDSALRLDPTNASALQIRAAIAPSQP